MLKISLDATAEQLAVCGRGNGSDNSYDIATLVIRDTDDVYITIDTIYNGSNGIRMDVANLTRLEFSIAGAPDFEALKRDLLPGGKAYALIEDIIAGWEIGNMRGRLNDEASDASAMLNEYFSEYEQANLMAWQAGDWLFSGNNKRNFFIDGNYSLEMSEQEIDDLAREMFDLACSDGTIIIGGVSEIRDTLRAAIEDLREEDAEAAED